MSDMDRIQQEIAENERWLAEVSPRCMLLDTTRIRQTVRIAVAEQWLARNDALTISNAAVERVKGAVRGELTATRRKRRHWPWAAGIFSAAAMIAVAVFTAKAPVEPQLINVESVSLVAALGTLDEWDSAFDAEISSLRDAFGAVDGSNNVSDESNAWESDWESWGEDGSSGT